ncbi:hypothetical protein EJB05_53172, partial [Eragrostis curvula]
MVLKELGRAGMPRMSSRTRGTGDLLVPSGRRVHFGCFQVLHGDRCAGQEGPDARSQCLL